jgi:hypothetical protein
VNDTVPVTYRLLNVERIHGAGKLIGLATIELDIYGIALVLQGAQIRRSSMNALHRCGATQSPARGCPACLCRPSCRKQLAQKSPKPSPPWPRRARPMSRNASRKHPRKHSHPLASNPPPINQPSPLVA